MDSNKRIYFITAISILSALSTILFFLGGIPIFIAFPYLKIDFSDIPALIGGIVVSPVAGILIEFIKTFIHLLRTHTAGIGELMSFVVGSSIVIGYCIPFRLTCKRYSKKISVTISYIICLFFTIIVSIIMNSIIYPLFLSSAALSMITKDIISTYLIAVVVLNFIKVTGVTLLSLIVVKISKIDNFMKKI